MPLENVLQLPRLIDADIYKIPEMVYTPGVLEQHGFLNGHENLDV